MRIIGLSERPKKKGQQGFLFAYTTKALQKPSESINFALKFSIF